MLKVKSKELSDGKPDMLAVSPSKFNGNSLHTGLISNYTPFISNGFLSLKNSVEFIHSEILRDTGASEALVLESVLPFSSTSSSGRSLLVGRIDVTTSEVPLHRVMLYSGSVEGELELGIRPALPVDDVHVIIGNNCAGGRVVQSHPVSVLSSPPQLRDEPDDCSAQFPDVFAACAVTSGGGSVFTRKNWCQSCELEGFILTFLDRAKKIKPDPARAHARSVRARPGPTH